MKCHQKICYHDGATAEDAQQRYIRDHKTDKRNARLVCYICRDCGKWHLGHMRRKQRATPKPVKQLTPGQLARKERKAAEREAHRAARRVLFADYIENLNICKVLIDRELARYAAAGIRPRMEQ